MKEDGFFEKVYKVVRQIPFGKVTTYGIIANYLGTPKSARMVGWALNNSKVDSSIPAHRVVNRKGILTGKNHFQATHLMKQLLENEGVKVVNDGVCNLEEYLWFPDRLK